MNNDIIDTLLAGRVKFTGDRVTDLGSVFKGLLEISKERDMVFVTGGKGVGYELAGVVLYEGSVHVDIRQIVPDHSPHIVITGFKKGTALPTDLVGVDPFLASPDPVTRAKIYRQCAEDAAFFINMLLSKRGTLPWPGDVNNAVREAALRIMASLEDMCTDGDFPYRDTRKFDLSQSEPVWAEQEGHTVRDHPADTGERTNPKLRVQPYWERGRNGKAKKW